MPIWKVAMEIAEKIFKYTNNLPRKEDYGFTSQIRRSGLSISANIAEAFGRYHTLNKINFCYTFTITVIIYYQIIRILENLQYI